MFPSHDRKAVNVISKQKSVEDFNGKIDNSVVNETSVNVNVNLGELKPYYTKLFSENAKLNDPQILEILIENRHKLKNRFNHEIKLYEKGKIVGMVNISGVLIEDLKDTYMFVNEGQTIDYLSQVLPLIEQHFKSQHGAIGGSSTTFNIKKVTIDEIRFNSSYA